MPLSDWALCTGFSKTSHKHSASWNNDLVRKSPDESFPRRFASGAVVGGPYLFYANGEDGELYDQSAFSSYYGDEELQAEATRVVRTAAMR